jgi:hypothetical protein
MTIAAQARRLAAFSGIQDPGTLGTFTEADIPYS